MWCIRAHSRKYRRSGSGDGANRKRRSYRGKEEGEEFQAEESACAKALR